MMKKKLLLMMAFVLSFMMGANAQVTEVLGAPSADKATFTGTSFTAGEGGQLTTGTQDVSGKTFLKIRTGNEGNSLTFSVIDGYAITGISMDAYSNNKSTSADRSINLTAVNIDEAESSILENVVKLPGGTAGQTPVNVSLSGFEAKKSIKMTFDNSNIVTETEDPAGKNKQIFAYIEVTYIALNADPVAEPAIKFTAGAVERTITVGLSAAGKVSVDWGNGEKVEQEAAAAYDGWDNALEFTGTPSGEVKIYGENINYLQSFTKYADGATVITGGITAIDLSNATTITELDLHQNNLTTVDLSKLTALTTLNIGVNDFTTIDLSANTELTKIDLSNGKNNGVLESVDLTKNTKLTNIVLSGNKLTSLDLSKNTVAKTITVLNNQLTSVTIGANTAKGHTFQFGGNKLTSFSLKDVADVATSYVYLRDNSLTSLELPSNVKRIWVDGNAFTLAQLADLKGLATQTFTYASTFTKPQAQVPYAIAEKIETGDTIDLSSQAMLGETATVFTWINKTDTLKAGTDYTEKNGKFTFLAAQDSLYCEMTNAELPAIKYTTTATKVEVVKELPLAITFSAPAVERTLTVGLGAAGKVAVDWGNGEKVEKEAAGAYDGWDNGLEFTGTPSGEVKIYGDSITYFEAWTKMTDGVVVDGISAIDLSNATALTSLDIHNNLLVSVDLTKNVALKKINVSANKLTAIDFSANTAATDIRVNANQITSFVLPQSVSTLYLSDNPLGTLDLTPYTTIKSLYALNCELTEANLGNNNVAKCYFSLNNNKLTKLDASAQTELSNGSLFLMNNNLTEVKLPATVKALNITGNKFDLASLYALTTSATFTTLTAASMQDYEIAETITDSINLSAQAVLGEAASTIKWFTEDGTELVEGTDYKVANGVFTFIKAQEKKVYATLLNAEALPKLTKAIKTTLATVNVTETTGIHILKVDGDNIIFNLKGQRIAAPEKGLFIRNGKKYVK